MFRGEGLGNSVPAALAASLVAASLAVAACGGSDDAEKPQTASSGAPTSGQGGDLVQPEAAKAINNPRPAEKCTNRRSNEEICSDYSNYLLSFRPATKDGYTDPDFAETGPYLVGKWTQNGVTVDSSAKIEDAGPGSGNDGKHCRTINTVPATCEYGPVAFGGLLQIDFDDDRSIGNSGSVRIAAQAGDVDFGTVHFWMKNMDGADDDDKDEGERNGDNDWAYCEKQRGGGGGPMFLSCGAPNDPTQGIKECEDDGDDEECGFSFYMQNYPVRVGVFSRLKDSELTVSSVTSAQPSEASDRYDFLRSDWATTLKKGSTVKPGGGGVWLAGYRAVAGAQIKVEARLKSTDPASESAAWAGAPVYLTATFVKTGAKEVTPVCEVQNASTGTQAKCSVNLTSGSVSQPGTVKFELYS